MNQNRDRHSTEAQWVLIITDDASFARDLTSRWQAERSIPEFTSVSSEGSGFIGIQDYDLAIVGRVPAKHLRSALLRTKGTPAVLAWVPPGLSPEEIRRESPNVLAVRESESMIEAAVMIGSELLLRTAYQKQLERSESVAGDNRIHAALGRYMIDSRPNFNNALMSVLGTAELMQLGDLGSAETVREHVKTIHMMALRMQSLLQHFSFLEAEMKLEQTRTRNDSKVLSFVPAADPQGRAR